MLNPEFRKSKALTSSPLNNLTKDIINPKDKGISIIATINEINPINITNYESKEYKDYNINDINAIKFR